MQSSIRDLKAKLDEAKAKAATPSPKKDFEKEITEARGSKSPVTETVANDTLEGQDLTVRDDAAERKARREAMNARVKAMADKQAEAASKKQVSALEQDRGNVFNSESKQRFAERKAAVLSAMQQMNVNTRRAVIKRLNIGHLMIEANPMHANLEVLPNANMQQSASAVTVAPVKSPIKVMQMVPVSITNSNAEEHLIELPPVDPAKSATFAEFLNFDSLCQASLAQVPAGHEITNEEVTTKLRDFIQVAQAFEVDTLLQFIESHQEYDRQLLQLRAASMFQRDQALKSFLAAQAQFIKLNEKVLPGMIDAVTHLSDLIAYLENNPQVAIEVRKTLTSEYEQTHAEFVQLQKALIERCGPTMCVILEIKSDKSESVTDVIKAIQTDKAFTTNNDAALTKLVK